MRGLFRVGGSVSWKRGSKIFHGRLSAGSFYRSGWTHARDCPLGQSPWSQTIQGTEFWPLSKVCPGIVLRCLLNLLFCQLKALFSRAPQQEGTTVPFLCFEGNWLTFVHPSTPTSPSNAQILLHPCCDWGFVCPGSPHVKLLRF